MQDHSILPEPVQTAVSQIMQVGSRVQPFSSESRTKVSRIRDAKVVKSVCPYCAVGCGLNVYVKDGRVIDLVALRPSFRLQEMISWDAGGERDCWQRYRSV